jgi:putative transposase
LSVSCSSQMFISLDEASRRSGLNVGFIRRMCSDAKRMAEGTLLSRGLAKLEAPAAGGKACWWVREDADARFARVKFAAQIGTDLSAFTAPQRKKILYRKGILTRWEEAVAAAFTLGFNRDAATNRFLKQLSDGGEAKISRATLYNWDRDYRMGGLAGLADERCGKSRGESKDDPDPFLGEVQRLYLSLRKPKLTVCHEMACLKAAELGWAIRTYKTCQRHVEKVPAAVVLKLRHGEEAYVNHAEPFLEGDYSTLESNELWNADHHPFDVLVKVSERLDGSSGEMVVRHVRPWLTAFQDVRSRKIVGWKVYAHDPNSDAVLSVFRAAVKENGVPRKLLIDNGKDFDCLDLNGRTKKDRWRRRKVHVELSEHARGVWPALGIEIQHAKPYHGQSKPVERWFGFVETRTVCWPTYTGNSTANKPEDLQLQLERGNAPTLEDFSTWFDDWVIAYNAGHQHQGDSMDGKTPDVVFAEQLATKRTCDARLLDILCLRRIDKTSSGAPLRIGQNGIAYKGLRYGQYALAGRLGEAVILRVDDEDLSEVLVFDADDKFICVAPCNVRVPKNATAQVLREAHASKRRDRKIFSDYTDRRPRMAEDLPERMLRAARAKARPAVSNLPPPSISPVRHPLEAQLDRIQTAIDRPKKIAVGAESLTPRPQGGFSFTPSQAPADVDDEESSSSTGLDSPLDFLMRHGGREVPENE